MLCDSLAGMLICGLSCFHGFKAWGYSNIQTARSLHHVPDCRQAIRHETENRWRLQLHFLLALDRLADVNRSDLLWDPHATAMAVVHVMLSVLLARCFREASASWTPGGMCASFLAPGLPPSAARRSLGRESSGSSSARGASAWSVLKP